ncbi:MAG: glycosyltransferase family 4 protein [Prevotella sp.]|nr:glycosyltransferase family 4 protein [Prevotella sp.]
MRKIIHIVSNNAWGGGEQYVFDLASRQLADGRNVEICCRPSEAVISTYQKLGIPVHPLPLRGVLDLKSACSLSRIVNEAGPCLIHAHNFKDAFTASYARKLSTNKDIRLVMCRHLTRKGKNTFVYRWLYGQLDRLIFDSEISRSEFLSTHPAIDEGKLGIVHTSIVVPSEMQKVDVRRKYNIPTDNVVAMYHGRHDAEKGLDVLMEAVAQLREKPFKLVLLGRGDQEYTDHLKALIHEKGIDDKVIFTGFVDAIPPFVHEADFGILPSVVREGCPLSPMEYMSQGHPVVTTDNGGQREYVVNEGNGLLVPPGDSGKLADAMARLIDDADLRQRLGKQAKADFDAKLNYQIFYQQILEQYANSL